MPTGCQATFTTKMAAASQPRSLRVKVSSLVCRYSSPLSHCVASAACHDDRCVVACRVVSCSDAATRRAKMTQVLTRSPRLDSRVRPSPNAQPLLAAHAATRREAR